MKKFSVSMNEDLCDELDSIAKKRFTTRSSLINLCVRDFVAKEKTIAMLDDIKVAIEKFNASGEMDEDAKQMFKDFEAASSLVRKYAVTQ